MPKLIYKQLYFKSEAPQADDAANYIIRGVFSTGDEDRQGDVVVQAGWDIKEYMENPTVLFAHDHYQPAVGKVIELGYNAQGNLAGAIKFAAEEYDFAMTLYKLYAGMYMRAFSAGFANNEYEVDQENDRFILKSNTLYEISCVNVPANAGALAASKGIDMDPLYAKIKEMRMKQKSVVPYADHGTAPEDTSWDGPAQIKACGDDLDLLKSICTWYDSENADVKSSYKLPHHEADGLKAVWKGVSAAMGALLGSMGGVDIPEAEKQGVYNHLAKHYKEFDKEVPEFKSYAADELKRISGEKKDIVAELSRADRKTLIKAKRTIDRVLTAEKEADKDKVSIKTLNKAIRSLLGAKDTIRKIDKK
jgi:HK97 family phage prohead protease